MRYGTFILLKVRAHVCVCDFNSISAENCEIRVVETPADFLPPIFVISRKGEDNPERIAAQIVIIVKTAVQFFCDKLRYNLSHYYDVKSPI